MRVASRERVLEYRYDLYCRAHDAFERRSGADPAQFHALAHRCKRTAEVISMAELLVENRYPKLAMAHLGSHYGGCTDCVRSACLSVDEIARASRVPQRLSA